MAADIPITRRQILTAAGAVAGVGLLAACSTGSRTAATGAVAATGAAVTVTDQRGVTVTLAHPATRVVTIPMPAASILVAVDGGAGRLVGMQSASWTAMKDGILGEFFPEALTVAHDVASSTFAPNVESIAALDRTSWSSGPTKGPASSPRWRTPDSNVVGVDYGTAQTSRPGSPCSRPPSASPTAGGDDVEHRSAQAAMTRATEPSPRAPPTVVYFNRFTDSLRCGRRRDVQRLLHPPRRRREPGAGPRHSGHRDRRRRHRAGTGVEPRDRPARQLRLGHPPRHATEPPSGRRRGGPEHDASTRSHRRLPLGPAEPGDTAHVELAGRSRLPLRRTVRTTCAAGPRATTPTYYGRHPATLQLDRILRMATTALCRLPSVP